MSIPIPIAKENAEKKARRVRLLRIWTDICAMVLCDTPHKSNLRCISLDLHKTEHGVGFSIMVNGLNSRLNWEPKLVVTLLSTDPDAEEKLADIQRRLKPYVA